MQTFMHKHFYAFKFMQKNFCSTDSKAWSPYGSWAVVNCPHHHTTICTLYYYYCVTLSTFAAKQPYTKVCRYIKILTKLLCCVFQNLLYAQIKIDVYFPTSFCIFSKFLDFCIFVFKVSWRCCNQLWNVQ